MKKPVVEMTECIKCEICCEVCPEVFTLSDLDFIEVAELAEYPEEEVDNCIQACPADCIAWEEGD